MRRLALLLAAILALPVACGDGSSPVRAVACPTGARCSTMTGDVDGDGRPDSVATYVRGDDVDDPDAGGVLLELATGRHVDLPFDVEDYWDGTARLLGVVPVDDLPGDEVLVATRSFRGTSIGVLHWTDGRLARVEGPFDTEPLQLFVDEGPYSAAGFSCHGDLVQRRLDRSRAKGWQASTTVDRWHHGHLVEVSADTRDLGDGDERPAEADRDAGIDCPGLPRFGPHDLAARPPVEPQPLCPADAYCVTEHGDLDGDGRPDDVTRYTSERGTEDEPAWEAGVVVRLADGTEARHRIPDVGDDVVGYGDIVGIAPLDDLPGDEVVVTTLGGGTYASARILRWDGHQLVEVLDPATGEPIDAGSGSHFRSSAGFACPVVDGERRFELRWFGEPEQEGSFAGDTTTYRWVDGGLTPAGERRTPLTEGDLGDRQGNDCPGFHHWGGADYPEY